MMLREGSRKVTRSFRTTLLGRLASMQQHQQWKDLSGSWKCIPTAVGTDAFDSREFGSAVGPHSSVCKQNARAKEGCEFSYSSVAINDTFGTRVFRAAGESVIAMSSVSWWSPWCPSSAVGVSGLDRHSRTPNSLPFHERAPVLADLLQSKSYTIQTRKLASNAGKPFQRTYEKSNLDSSVNKGKLDEDDKMKIDRGEHDRKNEDDRTDEKSLGARVKNIFSDLENVHVPALGLGLAGAIPFVALTPGIASILPLPESLYAVHIHAQAAYGAVILSFLGGPHWGLAMSESPKSTVSNVSIRTLRYVWSVIPSLAAFAALLLSPVPKLAALITSYGVVCGVDYIFARMGLLPSWYMSLRVLLTSIAVLSMTSSLIVTAAAVAVSH